jgi:hypothetical protein
MGCGTSSTRVCAIRRDVGFMNGPIAQIVALTIHGNAVLTGRPIPTFFPDNSTCRYCDEVTFAASGSKSTVPTPNEWFAFLRGERTRGLRLIYKPQNKPMISDRMSAGFVGGGGAWSIEAVAGSASTHWVGDWKVWDQHAPEQRIWKVAYRNIAAGPMATSPVQDPAPTTQRLLASLRAIRAFSHREKCDPFTGLFDQAIDTLSGPAHQCHGYHRDLSPAGFLNADSVMLLDAAQPAYVFGGMGSWNDLGFHREKQEEYERLSQDLFDALNVSIVEATNASYPQASH